MRVEPFHHQDGRLIGTIGLALDVTEQALISHELQHTRQIQAGLLPTSAPLVQGFDIAGASFPLADAGGDYFDYFPIRDGATGIIVCDVGGHGLGPALMMSQTRAYLRALALAYDDPGEILALVNRFLCEDIKEERLVTLFFAKLSPATRTLTYANAGHQGYLLGIERPAQLLKPTGIPLNVLDDAQIVCSAPVKLAAGDLIVLYTDGIVECQAADESQFSADRVLKVVRAAAQKTAREIVDELFHHVRDFASQGCITDDMTAVVIKVH